MTPEQVVEWLFSDHLGQNADVLTPVCYSPPDNPHLPRTLEDSWDREDVRAKLNELVESVKIETWNIAIEIAEQEGIHGQAVLARLKILWPDPPKEPRP